MDSYESTLFYMKSFIPFEWCFSAKANNVVITRISQPWHKYDLSKAIGRVHSWKGISFPAPGLVGMPHTTWMGLSIAHWDEIYPAHAKHVSITIYKLLMRRAANTIRVWQFSVSSVCDNNSRSIGLHCRVQPQQPAALRWDVSNSADCTFT